MKQVTRAGLSGLLIVLSSLLSCAGTGNPAVMQRDGSPVPGFLAGLPFPQDREASVISTLVKTGIEDTQRSAGAAEAGDSLVLDATATPLEYAIYTFNPGVEPTLVQYFVNETTSTGYYVAFADYEQERWSFDGPFNSSQGFSLDEAVNVSPLGNINLAIVVPGGESATLDSIELLANNDVPTALLTNSATGMAPIQIELDASGSTDSDGSIVLYEFDFENDGTFDVFGPDSSVIHLYASPGDVTARVRVTDNLGASALDSVSFSIAPPLDAAPVADLVISANGPAPHLVNLDASGSTDDIGITLYEWDLDADGAYELQTGTTPTTDTTFTTPGAYVVSVRVSDGSLQTDVASKTAVAQGWIVVSVDTAGETGFDPSLASINGRPAIAYQGPDYQNLRYAIADTEFGAEAADWSSFAIDVSASTGRFPCLKEINGSPAVTCGGNIGHVRYARASTARGEQALDWSVIDATTTSSGGDHSSLALIDGNPAFCFKDSNGDNLRYTRSTTASGSLPGDWPATIMIDSDANDLGSYSSLAEVDGKPAIAYMDQSNLRVKYAYSSTTDGMNPLAWTAIIVDGSSAYFPSLALVNGHPAIAYWYGTDNDVVYAYSSTVTGSQPADWGRIVLDGPGPQGVIPSLALVGGFPMVAHYSESPNQDLRFTMSDTVTGELLENWSAGENVDTAGDVGAYCSIADINGYPGIAYYAGAPAGDLKYAIGFH